MEEVFVGQKSGPCEGRESRADFTPLLPLLKRTRQTHHTAIIYIRTPRRLRWPPNINCVQFTVVTSNNSDQACFYGRSSPATPPISRTTGILLKIG